MGHRINERNIGNSTLESAPKKRAKKLNEDEIRILYDVIQKVYNVMEKDEDLNMFVDGGRFTLSLGGEQMYDLFQTKWKLKEMLK